MRICSMLTLNITDIRSEALKAKLDRIGLKNSRATSDEFRKHIGNLIELVHDAPSEDDVRSRIKDFFVDADISSREKIVLGKRVKIKKGPLIFPLALVMENTLLLL